MITVKINENVIETTRPISGATNGFNSKIKLIFYYNTPSLISVHSSL